MDIKAKARLIRISPKKVRLVADQMRGKSVADCLVQLSMSQKGSATVIEKLIKSAMANAQHNFNYNPDGLRVKEITVDQGPTIKRWRARAQGRATPIQKKTSHISLTLSDFAPEKVAQTAETPKEKPVDEKKTPKVEKEAKESDIKSTNS